MTLPEYFQKGIRYADYMAAFAQAVTGKRTSGPIQTEEMAHYTELNLARTKRIFKHTEPEAALTAAAAGLTKTVHGVCLTEFWCGDAAQNLPLIERLAEDTGKLEIRYLFRDDNTELMDRYLTNGGRSIPKYILFDAATGEELASWGPRPDESQRLMIDLKARNLPKEEIMEALQRWYNDDKTRSLQREWETLLRRISQP